jgi:hypothetical protein
MTRGGAVGLIGALAVLSAAAPAMAYEPERVWTRGSWLWSLEAGYGAQFNLEAKRTFSDIEFAMVGARWSLLPLGITGQGALRGALEAGLEPIYLHYTQPRDAYYAGVAVMGRYHFLSVGRFVPYLELGAAGGGTNLKVIEIDSSFSFLLLGGVGASYFLSGTYAVYAGYRWTHNSNGNIDPPNRGWEANTGVVGLTIFLR